MEEDYMKYINIRRVNKHYFFKLSDIKKYLIDDLDVILVKINEYNVPDSIYENEYIDFYSFVLLIAFSNDIRAYKYKFYLVMSTIEKICEINKPDLCIDRAKSLLYKKGYIEEYKYTNNRLNCSSLSFKEILIEEIESSLNFNFFRQII